MDDEPQKKWDMWIKRLSNSSGAYLFYYSAMTE